MLSCKDVSNKVAYMEELTFLNRMQLKVHFLMCKHCLNYKKQLELIEKKIESYVNNRYYSNLSKYKNFERGLKNYFQ